MQALKFRCTLHPLRQNGPIETPEGPNIGLISYLTSFARINKYGFIESPYRKINKETGVVTNEVVYMTADVEDNYTVAQANEPLDENGRFVHTRVVGRRRDEFVDLPADEFDFMDVSPKQVLSVATAMIPFLENDDANRALWVRTCSVRQCLSSEQKHLS